MNKNHLKLIPLSIVVIFILLTVVSSCTKGKPSHSINIRIQNISTLHMDSSWLGSSKEYGATQNTDYGEIPSNAITEYMPIEPIIYNYTIFSFSSDGISYFTSRSTDQHSKVANLRAGEYYTFVYDFVDGNVELTITHDEDVGKKN